MPVVGGPVQGVGETACSNQLAIHTDSDTVLQRDRDANDIYLPAAALEPPRCSFHDQTGTTQHSLFNAGHRPGTLRRVWQLAGHAGCPRLAAAAPEGQATS